MESFLSSDAWKQQWAAFWSAPGVIGPLILIVGGVVWWFRGTMFEREIAGLEEQIAALEQRLKLATEQMAASVRATDELEKEFQLYKDDVFLEGSMASSADVDAAIVKVEESNARIKDAVGSAVAKLEAAQYEALKELDAEAVKKLESKGWPFKKFDGDKKDD
jgi:hypothetical protein